MTVKIYIPRDAAAVALGAEKVAKAVAETIAARGLDATIIRNGSRGMHWLEPLVEVETAEGRVAYGPVKARDVGSLLDAGLLDGGDHALCLGKTEEIPFLKQQTRLTLRAAASSIPCRSTTTRPMAALPVCATPSPWRRRRSSRR